MTTRTRLAAVPLASAALVLALAPAALAQDYPPTFGGGGVTTDTPPTLGGGGTTVVTPTSGGGGTSLPFTGAEIATAAALGAAAVGAGTLVLVAARRRRPAEL